MVIRSDPLQPPTFSWWNCSLEWLRTSFELKGMYWNPVEFKDQDAKKCFQEKVSQNSANYSTRLTKEIKAGTGCSILIFLFLRTRSLTSRGSFDEWRVRNTKDILHAVEAMIHSLKADIWLQFHLFVWHISWKCHLEAPNKSRNRQRNILCWLRVDLR